MNRAILILSILTMLVACGSTQVAVKIDEDYQPSKETKVLLGKITNATGNEYDIDVSALLKTSLESKLRENELLSSQNITRNITVSSEIVEYEKGDAFKRWLWPGYGSTILAVDSQLKDYDGNIIGSITSRHTIDAGGAYTIGAWEEIFEDVSEDIVEQLSLKLKLIKRA